MCAKKSVIGKLKDKRGWQIVNNVTNINPKKKSRYEILNSSTNWSSTKMNKKVNTKQMSEVQEKKT